MNIINISNHPILGLKRKVSWHAFIYDEKSEMVRLFTTVSHFNNINDEYGDPFQSNAIKDFERILVASNGRMVSPVTGLTCSQNQEGVWTDLAGNTVEEPIGHFNLFKNIIQNPVVITTLINNTIINEDIYYKTFD